MKHIVISGAKGVGKSALIERLLRMNHLPVCGFVTRKSDRMIEGAYPIYIFPASEKNRPPDDSCCVGLCNRKVRKVYAETFETLGAQYLQGDGNAIVVMDELGMMEADVKPFTAAVMRAFDDDKPVIAALKSRRDIAFLNAVRMHPKVQVYELTEENRDRLYEKLLPIIRQWNQAISNGEEI